MPWVCAVDASWAQKQARRRKCYNIPMAKQSEKVSVLIPMYNVEQYFARCIESVINQTYKNLEIVIVDDGSEDQRGAIAEQYAAKDDRIKIIKQRFPNGQSVFSIGICVCIRIKIQYTTGCF